MKDVPFNKYKDWEISLNLRSDIHEIEYLNTKTAKRSRHTIELHDYGSGRQRYNIAVIGPQGMCKESFEINLQKYVAKKLKELMNKYK
ncbi:MAG: hypothetical protein IMZ53_01900 [Thermoplasmata archaeon]|nr:hypothetical protein [Thermoplasmata archaeon]